MVDALSAPAGGGHPGWGAQLRHQGDFAIAWIILACCALAGGGSVKASAQNLGCVAYRRIDELRARCGSKDFVIVRRRGLLLFAIAGGRLATAAVGRSQERPPAKLNLYDLHGWQEKDFRGAIIYASCGMILSATNPGSPSAQSWDVYSGEAVDIAGLARPVCNERRTVVVGIDKSGSLSTKSGAVIARRQRPDPLVYGLSPDGRFVAYSGTVGSLCISMVSNPRPACFSANVQSEGMLAVDDAGRTLYVAPTGGPCYYSGFGGQHVSERGKAGQADACFGVYMASPEAPPKLLVSQGSGPVWIPHQVAENLARLMSR